MSDAPQNELLLVVDFGGQYTQLIARRVREQRVFTEIIPWCSEELPLKWAQARAVILSGGPRSVLEPDSPTLHKDLLLSGKPVLGICYGQQLIAKLLGGKVVPTAYREYGKQALKVIQNSLILKKDGQVWMSHGDTVETAPPGFIVTARTERAEIAGMEDPSHLIFGVQFHPEVSHTEDGRDILRRFLFDVAGFSGDWTPENFIKASVEAIAREVGKGRVLCAVSGGVDSTVTAALCYQAIGKQLRCVFVDHGLLRKNEAEQVINTFTTLIPAEFVPIDAREEFFSALKGITDPEEKRRVIGETFVKIFEEHAEEIKGCDFLAQGTLYPDVIESGSPTAAKIKTHHNVGALPPWMRLKLIEPLRWLFKDEVREVGRQLGLPEEVIDREPFPGPGLAVRILGEVTPERVRIVQEADAIWREELKRAGITSQIWQSYAALLNVRSVGVQGDVRTYEHPIVLRAVASEDAMTASAVAVPFEVLERVATRIVNEVPGVNRVLYDLTSKPPATIEWE
jgi:GMP synthase (glutamine-hydrolysing)